MGLTLVSQSNIFPPLEENRSEIGCMNEPGEVKTDLFFLVGKNALLQMEYWNKTH